MGFSGERQFSKKTNLRKLPAIAAITGESNFDLGEALWIKLLTELQHEEAHNRFAMQDGGPAT